MKAAEESSAASCSTLTEQPRRELSRFEGEQRKFPGNSTTEFVNRGCCLKLD
jgi:hypothetical protein